MKEKRRFERVSLDTYANYSSDKRAQVKNISQGGLCITTDHFISKGTLLFLVVSLSRKGMIQVIGESVWCRKKGEGVYENGISFFCLDDFNVRKLKEYIGS
ncbi:MAG: PilZ domain-containing protein [Spirochaetales bacterium]|nr:PilZ domain-containing protein [Spirochaetales bacterium]